MSSVATLLLTLALLLSCSGLSLLIMRAVARVSGHYSLFRLLLLPGIMLHELSHAAACFLTGTHVERISFWDETGGSVIHHKPKLAFMTQPFISFAPFPIGLAALYYLTTLLQTTPGLWTVPLLLLMVSIAATLSPSRVDAINALEGIVVFAALLIAIYVFAPNWYSAWQPYLITFNQNLYWLVGGLGALWAILTFLHTVLRRT